MASERQSVATATRPTAGIARWTRSTPGLFRMLSVLAVIGIVAAGAALLIAANALTASSARVENNTGPVIVATQGLFASIAEADAAASAVFLSGANGDRAQRNLYEDALARSTEQVEDIARLVGDGVDVHDSLKSILRDIAVYAGQVEQARLANLQGDSTADARLQDAIATVRAEMVPEVERIRLRTEQQLSNDIDEGKAEVGIALGATFVALMVIGLAHVKLARRTRRLINVPLLLAGLILLVAAGWMLRSYTLQQGDLDAAVAQGSDAIALSAQMQSTAFQLKTDETVAVVEGGSFDTTTRSTLVDANIDEALLQDIRDGVETGGDGLLIDAARLADGNRERAAVADLLIRWQRYSDVNREVEVLLGRGDNDAARSLSVGAGNDAFTGFNAAVEGVLLDNRQQFIDRAVTAGDRVGSLPIAMFLLPLLAAIAAMLGFQMRINDFR